MRYDIALYPRNGQSWADVIAADELDGPPMDADQLEAGVASFRRIEARLREHLTEPVEVWVAEETDGDVLGELTATESGLQVELYDRSASVSFPVQDRPDPAGFHEQVRQAVRAVVTETGYEAYDPQTRRSFDGLIDDGSEPTFSSMTSGAAGAAGTAAVPAATGPAAPTSPLAAPPGMDARMLRRRSVLYLVIGIALVVFTLMRFSAGDTSWLTWLFGGFAAFNLVAGAMMRTLARQAEEQQATQQSTATGSSETRGADDA